MEIELWTDGERDLEVEEKVKEVFTFALATAEEHGSWERGVYALAQGLQGIVYLHASMNSWESILPIVEEWAEALVDDDLDRGDDTSEIVLRFRQVWPKIRNPYRFEKGGAKMSDHLADAAKRPPNLAREISRKLYGGSGRATALLSVLLALRDLTTDGVFYLSCRMGATALGLDAATGGPARVAELLKLMVADGVLAIHEPASRSRAARYIWRGGARPPHPPSLQEPYRE